MVSLRSQISHVALQKNYGFRTEEDIGNKEDGQDGVVLGARKSKVLSHSLYSSPLDLSIGSEQ